MKKSAQVKLTLVATMALAGCSRPYDPCRPQTFNAMVCQEAIGNGGYYYGGGWYPMSYGHSYGYYYNSYAYHVSNGGRVSSPGVGSYAHPSGSVSRGGFGSTGSHGAGS